MKENFFENIYIKEGQNYPENIKKDLIEEYKKKDQAEIEKINRVSSESIFEGKAEAKIAKIHTEIQNEFLLRGIDQVKTLPVFFRSKHKSDVDSFEQGRLHSTHIDVEDFASIEQKLLREIEATRLLCHELYHSTMTQGLEIIGSKAEYRLSQTKAGASHLSKGFNGPFALEEGAAINFEKKILERVIDKDDLADYNQFLKRLNTDNFEPALDGTYRLLIYSYKRDKVQVGSNTKYRNSELLFEYIESRIPDFLKLLEQSRIHMKTLPLANAMEKEFGKGYYRKITTCGVSDAKTLLQELQDK